MSNGLSAQAKEVLDKLPPAVRDRILAQPQILKQELKTRESYYPTKNMVPNIAQERSFEHLKRRHPVTGDFCKESYFLAGNGIGKTTIIPMLLAGMCLGKEFLNPTYFSDVEFFDHCRHIRSKRALRVRIVCDAADVEENGSVTQRIREYLPIAKFEGKVGGSQNYYTQITIPAPAHGFKPTVIDIKTHGQRPTAHAGPDMDAVIFNEPAPEPIYLENASRTRKGGYIFGYMTPLRFAPYLAKVIDAPGGAGKINVTRGSIWDNCIDIPGTRGVLTRANVEDQIRRWRAVDPIEAEAREHGTFMHLSGAVFKLYRADIHSVPVRSIGRNWVIYLCIDPHEAKPPFATWMAHDPLGDWFVIAEYPTEPWDQISTTHLTIKDFISDFKRVESGHHPKFPYMRGVKVRTRFGDPNRFKCEQPHNRRTFREEYEFNSGWDLDIDIPDSVELRHDKLKDLIKFDHARALDSMNRPHLYVFDSCENVGRAFQNYIYREKQGQGKGLSDKVDETWECPVSCCGYTVISADPWRPGQENDDSDEDESTRDSLDPHVIPWPDTSLRGERLI
jgi:hypothetical protein